MTQTQPTSRSPKKAIACSKFISFETIHLMTFWVICPCFNEHNNCTLDSIFQRTTWSSPQTSCKHGSLIVFYHTFFIHFYFIFGMQEVAFSVSFFKQSLETLFTQVSSEKLKRKCNSYFRNSLLNLFNTNPNLIKCNIAECNIRVLSFRG